MFSWLLRTSGKAVVVWVSDAANFFGKNYYKFSSTTDLKSTEIADPTVVEHFFLGRLVIDVVVCKIFVK